MKGIVGKAAAALVFIVVIIPAISGQGSQADLQGLHPEKRAANDAIPYRLEWAHHYEFRADFAPKAVADKKGTLWLTAHLNGDFKDFLVEIAPDGTEAHEFEPRVPLKRGEWVAYVTPAVSDQTAALLVSLASGGKNQTFEGAFFIPIAKGALDQPIRVTRPGPQFPTLVATERGHFIAAGDQEPLTILELDGAGNVLWKRSFSRRMFLPTVSVSANGSIFVLTETERNTVLLVLNDKGQVIRVKQVAAWQGLVLADAGGGCTLLCTKPFHSDDRGVSLIRLDAQMAKICEVRTPYSGALGRTYELYPSPRGYLALGDSLTGPNRAVVPPKLLIEFDRSGRVLWQHSLSGVAQPLLVAFDGGFYLVQDEAGTNVTIDRYVY